MRKAGSTLFAVIALAASLLVAGPARATGYEDGLEDCSYPKMVDLFVMRPLGLFSIALGTVLFVPTAPMVALMSRSDMGDVANTLVARPVGFTFGRPLGECVASSRL
jgi:hypothetical protein